MGWGGQTYLEKPLVSLGADSKYRVGARVHACACMNTHAHTMDKPRFPVPSHSTTRFIVSTLSPVRPDSVFLENVRSTVLYSIGFKPTLPAILGMSCFVSTGSVHSRNEGVVLANFLSVSYSD